ncbi:MAG TPA: beta-ketoacyl-[acyl-carrier-protein] synthase family protein [Candidatus Dormibacteraeota bacterium]|nr:beta-ketoacyl-[acyl-carrier-protein] synthase family protein [Candidatus Dormibacteraeota bacterium]
MTTPERVAIVAAGVVTPIGQDLEAFWSALVTGASGISQIERVEVADLRVQRGGEIKKIGRIKNWRGVPDCRATRLLIAAADDLCAQAAFRPLPLDPTRVAVVVGTALGGVEEGEKALGGDRGRRRLRDALYDAPAWDLARWLGARGPVVTVSTACASGATALAVGADLLRSGEADAVVAGGYDALCRFVLRGFNALRSLSRDAVRPFDRRRSGLLLGEAGALGLLMRERDVTGARLGTLRGYGSASDGFHIAAPEPEGRGLERAIRAALADARLTPGDVDFVSAHGTATPLNDRIETAALKRALGPRAYEVPVNSIKGSLGHTMGAAAALEAFMCLLSAQRGLIPPTLNLEEPDPECDLDYVPGRARPARPRIMLSTSMGFGGCNGALILEGA